MQGHSTSRCRYSARSTQQAYAGAHARVLHGWCHSRQQLSSCSSSCSGAGCCGCFRRRLSPFLNDMSAEQYLEAVEERLMKVETMQQAEAQQILKHLTLQPEDQYELPPLDHVWDNPQLDLRGLRGVYWQPSNSVNPAIEAAIFWPNGDCDFLQYTVGRRHGIKHNATLRFLQRIDRLDNRVRIMFVVPPDVYDKLSWQPCLKVDGSVRLKPVKTLAALPQYKVRLPIPHSPRSTKGGSIEQQQSTLIAV